MILGLEPRLMGLDKGLNGFVLNVMDWDGLLG